MRLRTGIGHELLIIIVRFTPILISTLDPDSPAQGVPGFVFRFLSPRHKRQRPKHIRVWAGRFVRVRGIEPPTTAWKAVVLPLNYTRKRGELWKCTYIVTLSAANESECLHHETRNTSKDSANDSITER